MFNPKSYALAFCLILGSIAGFNTAKAQVINPGTPTSGSPANNDCAKFVVSGGNVQSITTTGAPCSSASTPSALSETNDTNVTLTLSGTPATALLQSVGMQLGWTGTLAAARLNSNVVQGVTNDTNIQGSISAQTLTFSWAGVLAAARLNSNVVQGVTNDTNIQGSISAQNLTFSWAGQLAISRGGTGAGTQGAAAINIFPTPTRAGDIVFWNGSAWATLPGNNSGTQVFSENSSGIPSWTTGTGVTSITCFGVAITTSGTCITTGQIPGIASNTAATSGNVGEIINSCVTSGSAVSLSTGTAKDVTTISVTAGDWNIEGNIFFTLAGTTSITAYSAYISDGLTNTLPTPPNITTNFPDGGGMQFLYVPAVVPGATNVAGIGTTKVRALLASTSTIRLGAFLNFSVSTASAYGCITATRER